MATNATNANATATATTIFSKINSETKFDLQFFSLQFPIQISIKNVEASVVSSTNTAAKGVVTARWHQIQETLGRVFRSMDRLFLVLRVANHLLDVVHCDR